MAKFDVGSTDSTFTKAQSSDTGANVYSGSKDTGNHCHGIVNEDRSHKVIHRGECEDCGGDAKSTESASSFVGSFFSSLFGGK
jgi:hypothetical protein